MDIPGTNAIRRGSGQVLLGVTLATVMGCGSLGASASTSAGPPDGSESQLPSLRASPTATATASASGVACAMKASAPIQHQAPELEALLPEVVAGRTLARWSLAGRCWVEFALDGTGVGADTFVASFEDGSDGRTIDLERLQ